MTKLFSLKKGMPLPSEQCSNIIHICNCPTCNTSYIGSDIGSNIMHERVAETAKIIFFAERPHAHLECHPLTQDFRILSRSITWPSRLRILGHSKDARRAEQPHSFSTVRSIHLLRRRTFPPASPEAPCWPTSRPTNCPMRRKHNLLGGDIDNKSFHRCILLSNYFLSSFF